MTPETINSSITPTESRDRLNSINRGEMSQQHSSNHEGLEVGTMRL